MQKATAWQLPLRMAVAKSQEDLVAPGPMISLSRHFSGFGFSCGQPLGYFAVLLYLKNLKDRSTLHMSLWKDNGYVTSL